MVVKKRGVHGFIKLRRKIKIEFLNNNIELFNKSPREFAELARKQIGYSCRTFYQDIYTSFKKLKS